ncbi:endonuclease/exonuclease/phosphatase family protein [Wenyingzhuangia sp. IMCC45533]
MQSHSKNKKNKMWLLGFLIFFSVVSVLPEFDSKHWIFRISDFVRLQLAAIILILLVVSFFVISNNADVFANIVRLVTTGVLFRHIHIIYPYFPKKQKKSNLENNVSLLSVNVMQENTDYQLLIDLVKKEQPDMLLVMESDKNWEEALRVIESSYEYACKIPQDNRYGMHFYTNLSVAKCEKHALISEEHPSIKAYLNDGEYDFIFWGIHPPPPSPTEKETSKQKDAELMKLARLIRKEKQPVVVSGDFNNVCWSKVSKVFAKVSGLRDARINRGFFGTFPSHYRLLRFPIDLLFHSKEILIHKIRTLSDVGSDHLPLFSEFNVRSSDVASKKKISEAMNLKLDHVIHQGEKAAEIEN